MKYSVSINEKKRTVTVTLADGSKGVARCCPSDQFNISTGIELALERAKTANKKTSLSIVELVKTLEAALPEGQMVIVGKGEEMTEAQKQWLRSLAGNCSCKCHNEATKAEGGKYYTEDEIDEIREESYDEGHEASYDKGHQEGYDECYEDAKSEYCGIEEQRDEYEATLQIIREQLEEVGII
jgi:flagellar biosynthesis/type III secretory pathway protein FliH